MDQTQATVGKPYVASAAKDNIVTIEVGPELEQYNVHKALLVHHSKYFQKALNGPWKEAQEGVVVLDDVNSTAFALFVHWLYTQQIPKNDDLAQVLDLKKDDTPSSFDKVLVDFCIKAYVLGDRLFVPEFRNAVNNHLAKSLKYSYDYRPSTETISFAFDNIPVDRVVLQLLVDNYCAEWELDWPHMHTSMEAQKKLPLQFLLRVMRNYKDLASQDESTQDYDILWENTCCYYEHATEAEQEACDMKHMVYDEMQEHGVFEDGARKASSPGKK